MRISTIHINNEELKLGKLNIIVGPNGVGKTTFLINLFNEFAKNGSSNNLKWKSLLADDSINISNQDWIDWARSLQKIPGSTYSNGHGTFHFFADAKTLGRQIKPQMLEEGYLDIVNDGAENGIANIIQNPQFRHIEKCFYQQRSVMLRVDDRLFVGGESNRGAYLIDSISSLQPAPFLAENQDILKSINKKVAMLFGKKIFSESRGQFEYELYSASKDVPCPKHLTYAPSNISAIADELEKWQRQYSVIKLSEEGHGIRAAVQVLYELENESNKIVFIDEPELHLYPTAKYMLGKYIGEYVKKNRKQIIISTHDSDLLKGLIESGANSTIVRINRDHGIKSIAGEEIRPETPSSVLEAVYSDLVIEVEGIKDQFVYTGAIHHKKIINNGSYKVLAENGKENISNNFYLFEKLGIRYAAILDFDSLYGDSKKKEAAIIKCIKNTKTIKTEERRELLNKINTVEDFLKNMPDKKRGLLCKSLNEEQKDIIENLLEDLRKIGLFVCPIGELENWVGRQKTSELTPERILSIYKSRCNSTHKGLTLFLEELAAYLST